MWSFIGRVTILSLALAFVCNYAFSAPKEKDAVPVKIQSSQPTTGSTVKKQVPAERSVPTRSTVGNTAVPTETAPATVKPANPEVPAVVEPLPAPTSNQAAAYSIDWFVIAAGGGSGTSTNYSMDGTVGQTAVGEGTSTNYELNSGFWQNFTPAGCCVAPRRGDLNGDGVDHNVLDLTFCVDRIFRGGPLPACPEEGDVNSDGVNCNVLDLTFIVDRIFRGGPAAGPC